ncbi:MAG: hypothetical protein CXZ00_15825 [Acidobacteria bacterium]|nr:MAG: hypothetical protein CXZ00_15825 [Acidobacteriota bacterium]
MKLTEKAAKMLGIRRGEFVLAASLSAYLFLTIASYVVSKNVRDALFLHEYGAVRLPYVSIVIAVLVWLFSAISLGAAKTIRHNLLVTGTLLLFAVNAAVLWWLARFGFRWVSPTIYVWTGIFGIFAPLQVWTLASLVLTTRQAKRLYAFIGAGGLLGGIAGGLFTSSLAYRIGAEQLLLGVVGAMLISAALVQLVVRTTPREEMRGTPDRFSGTLSGLRESASVIFNSRYLIVLAGLVAIGGVVTSLVEYQFKAVAGQALHSKEALAIFFGRFYAYAGIGSFLIQVFLTAPLMRRFGLGFTILLAPVGLLLGSAGFLIWGTLLSAIVLRGQDQLVKHSIDRTSVELLYVPLPVNTKVAVKSFIDSGVSRAADALAGILLIVMTTVAGLSPRITSILNIALIVFWIVLALRARKLYRQELRTAISSHCPPEVQALVYDDATPDARTLDEFREELRSGDPDRILSALQFVQVMRACKSLMPELTALLEHRAPEVRARSLDVLISLGSRHLNSEVEKLLRDESPRVQAKALEYLLGSGVAIPLDSVFSFPARRRAGKSFEFSSSAVSRKKIHNSAAPVEAYLERQEHNRAPDNEGSFYSASSSAVNDQRGESTPYRTHAHQEARDSWITLLSDLTYPKARTRARKAPANQSPEIHDLEEMFFDCSIANSIRLDIPQTICDLKSDDAWGALDRMLDQEDLLLRLAALRAMYQMRASNNELVLSDSRLRYLLLTHVPEYFEHFVLLNAIGKRDRPSAQRDVTNSLLYAYLREKMDRCQESIFRLIALRHKADELRAIYLGLGAEDSATRANSLELLDLLLDVSTRPYLIPILDWETSADKKLKIAQELGVWLPMGSLDVLHYLLQSSDQLLVLCTVDYIYRFHKTELYRDADQVAFEKFNDNRCPVLSTT